MLTTSFSRLPYHGWLIQIVPEQQSFVFECYAPGLLDYMNDAQSYTDWSRAYAAACQFIDREIAVEALIEEANGWLAAGLITDNEYWNLTCFD